METFAVCFDNKNADRVADLVKQYYHSDCEIVKYNDSTKLIRDCRKRLFDAIFLSTDMPELNGVQAAEILYQENKYTKIIIVTDNEEYAFRAYRYAIFRCIHKKHLDTEIKEAVESLHNVFESNNKYILLNSDMGFTEKRTSDIYFIEVLDHTVTVRTKSGDFEVYGTIAEYAKLLGNKGFIRTHKSFLVNCEHINHIGKTDVILSDGRKIPLSRNKINETLTKYKIFKRTMQEQC